MSDRFDPNDGYDPHEAPVGVDGGEGRDRSVNPKLLLGLLALIIVVIVLLMTVFKADETDVQLPDVPTNSQTQTAPSVSAPTAPADPNVSAPVVPPADPAVSAPVVPPVVTPPTTLPQVVE